MTGLAGKRILVTRPRAQAAELCDRLAARGAEPISFPTIQIAPPEDYTALDRAIAELAKYQWVIFTSVNGVAAFWERLSQSGGDASALRKLKIAAIGPATALALGKHGVSTDLIPDEYVAEAIAKGIGDVRGQWILLPRAVIAREALAVELRHRGALVEEVPVYRTLLVEPDPRGLAELQRGVDAITFTSPSTVRGFVALFKPSAPEAVQASSDDAGLDLFAAANRPLVACIGPVTAETARQLGLPVDIMAAEHTIDGLVAALAACFTPAEATRLRRGHED